NLSYGSFRIHSAGHRARVYRLRPGSETYLIKFYAGFVGRMFCAMELLLARQVGLQILRSVDISSPAAGRPTFSCGSFQTSDVTLVTKPPLFPRVVVTH